MSIYDYSRIPSSDEPRRQRKPRKPRKPRRWFFLFLLLAVSAIFGLNNNVEEYASAKASPLRVVAAELRAVKAALVPPPVVQKPEGTKFSGYIGAKENLTEVLMREGISRDEVLELVRAFRKGVPRSVFNPNVVRRGDHYEVIIDDKYAIQHLKYIKHGDHVTRIIAKRENGVLKAWKETLPLRREVVVVSGRVHDSIWNALQKTGENPALLCDKLGYIFEYYIDFYNDCQKGDRFSFAVEKLYGKSDAFVRYGDILAAEYEGGKESFQAFRYVDPTGKDNYYDSKGRSLQGLFLRKPLNFTRISSKFAARRFHPILKKYIPHHGVDYAAPHGTKIWAIADGTVSFVGRKGALGHYVEIKHNNGYKTGYGHLSRYARGLKPGQRVKQKQTIGYVGATGRATGPHLHFNFYATINGKYKLTNPTRTINRPTGSPVPAKYMAHFRQQRDQYFALLDRTGGSVVTASLPPIPTVAAE